MTNLTSGGSIEQIVALCQLGVLGPFCDLLSARDEKTVVVVLDGLINILGAAEKMDQVDNVAMMIEEAGGLDKIESLQTHENEEIYQKALAIIENYFGENEDDSELAPESTNEGFTFNGETKEVAPTNGNGGGQQFNF